MHVIGTMLRLIREESGATAIEYGLIATLISIVIVGAPSAGRDKSEQHFHDGRDQYLGTSIIN